MPAPTSPRFDNRAKDEILSRVDIAQVIGRYVNLKQVGSSLKGLCPFHKEKTPSFHVNPARGIFHCFGCGKGGDVFTFLMEHEGLEFKEALAQLAVETGVPLDARPAESEGPAGPAIPKTELLKIHEVALQFYYQQVRQSSIAVDYFKARGLAAGLVREFMLGYAPEGWSSFCQHAGQAGFSDELLLAAGLGLQKSEKSSTYDRFRDRIMFPLCDITGRCIAFAGRGLNSDTQPKYLNSPETALYHKSKTLYGLHKSKAAIKTEGSVLIVEGYIDYLTLFQAGICNVTATSGTALTPDHVQILRRFTSNVFLVFDGDDAGIAAAQRALPIFAPAGLTVKVLVIPDQEDPDSFVRKHGAEAFKKLLLTEAQHYLTYGLNRALAHHPLGDGPEAKSAVIAELTPLLTALADPIIRGEFIKQIAERLELDARLIQGRFNRSSSVYPRAAAPEPKNEDVSADYLRTQGAQFIALLIHHPRLAGRAQELITPEIFTDDFSAKLYSMVVNQVLSQRPVEALMSENEDAHTKTALSAMLAKPVEAPDETIDEEFAHCVQRLRSLYLKNQLRLIVRRIKAEPQNAFALLQQQKVISSQLHELQRT
ncbi:MAG: DNA primase [Chitinivibrionales bacterium]|nr:DNA primase [Chitinivibrionales bacterium]